MEEMTLEKLKKEIWSKAFALTAKIEYAKRYEKAELMGKYKAYKEIWEMLGGDTEDNKN